MQNMTPEFLFDRAKLVAGNAVAWGTDIPERGPGVYIITIEPAVNDQSVVYIGRSKQLFRRLGQFYRHQFGRKSPHKGGETILLLPGGKTVHWASAIKYAEAEDTMIEAFCEVAGGRPIGNRMKSASMGLKSD